MNTEGIMIPGLLERIVGTVIRTLLAPVFTILTAKGYITESDSAQLIIEIGVTAVAVIWGVWSKYKDVILIHLGLKMQTGSTYDQLKNEARDGKSLSAINKTNVLIPLLLVGVLGLSACGGDAAKKTEEAIRKVYIGLQAASESVEILNRDGKLSDARALQAYGSLNKIGAGTKQFKEAIRSLGAITPENKGGLIEKLDLIIAQIDLARKNDLIGISVDAVAKIELNYELAKAGFISLKGLIAAVKKPVPVRELPALAELNPSRLPSLKYYAYEPGPDCKQSKQSNSRFEFQVSCNPFSGYLASHGARN